MGLLRFVLQGVGWRVGREIAEEGIDEVRARTDAEPPPPSAAERARVAARDARAHAKAERVQAREREAAVRAAEKAKRERDAQIERELEALRRKIDRDQA
ncbi:MAG: hypothetical protein IPH07_30425 [Deltaproteobacteria bacterium]|nr:hypothetical protein [Deltaproteobacteria bacterium]MBK8715231.1 hypothetical protein [Deltaproteobacteria bacterium]MBP7285063.1 hypothetical protein [Nannocystaceae bacterium]